MFAQAFPTGGDRDGCGCSRRVSPRRNNNWYRQYWTQQQRDARRSRACDSLWNKQYRPKLQGYLNKHDAGERGHDPFAAAEREGRSVSGGKERSIATVGFPERQSDAIEAIYVFVHEVASAVANKAVSDNTTPARSAARVRASVERRAGFAAGSSCSRRSPGALDGYARYYLRAANVIRPGDGRAQLAREFPLPRSALGDPAAGGHRGRRI